MPNNYRIGATSSTGVNLLDATRYRNPADSWRGDTAHDSIMVPMIGGPPVLVRHQDTHKTWDWMVRCRRTTGHQERLDDFDAIGTQLQAAIDFSLGDSATPIYLWENWGNQTAVRQYLIIRGWLVEEERMAGGANLHLIGRLHLDTRLAGA